MGPLFVTQQATTISDRHASVTLTPPSECAQTVNLMNVDNLNPWIENATLLTKNLKKDNIFIYKVVYNKKSL